MDITIVTPHFASSVARIFRNHGQAKILDKNYSPFSTDLVIFTGGEDVNPRYYGEEDSDPEGWYNSGRDELELKVFKDIMNGKIRAKKVLGICRGLQLINVGMGGTLIFDIRQRFGFSHNFIHDLLWPSSSIFQQIFPSVNSMHHQGILSTGRKLFPEILAVEPRSKVTEIIVWGNRFLGVQFHPESMQEGEKFADIVAEWVSDRISLSNIPEEENQTTKKKALFGGHFEISDESAQAFARVSASVGNAEIFLTPTEEEEENFDDEDEDEDF